jgi:hypothetical protein
MGRPKRTLTPKDYEVIADLMARHVSFTQISKALRMDYNVFRRLRDEDETLKRILDEALEAERADLHGVLYQSAVEEKNIISAMFLLKARHGYRDSGPAADVNVAGNVLVLPAPSTPEDYRRMLAEANAPANATTGALSASRALPEAVEVTRG